MTEKNKKIIRELRMNGWGYGRIAKLTGLNEETIKSHCQKYGLNGYAKDILKAVKERELNACKNCGARIEQNPKRKRKTFCSSSCRTQWWNERPYLVNKKAYYALTCKNCGKEFQAYGNSKRKYCCFECYIADRFYANREENPNTESGQKPEDYITSISD